MTHRIRIDQINRQIDWQQHVLDDPGQHRQHRAVTLELKRLQIAIAAAECNLAFSEAIDQQREAEAQQREQAARQ